MAGVERPASAPSPDGDRLSCWKEIAGHLGRSVRTALRWEKELGLPVHRVHGKRGEIVYALRSEIDCGASTPTERRASRTSRVNLFDSARSSTTRPSPSRGC